MSMEWNGVEVISYTLSWFEAKDTQTSGPLALGLSLNCENFTLVAPPWIRLVRLVRMVLRGGRGEFINANVTSGSLRAVAFTTNATIGFPVHCLF
jgi:hypothetical protein